MAAATADNSPMQLCVGHNKKETTMTYMDTPTVSAPTISSSAMLVELSISTWTARKRDRTTTTDVLSASGASKTAGAFNKNLMADCGELVAIQKFASNTRTMHYNMTLPWSDSGLRLLPTAKYFDYHKQLSGLHAEFDRLVQLFLDAYDFEVAQMHLRLGSLFHQDEYPTGESIRHKFAFRMSYIPVPDTGDWRVEIENDAQDQLKEQYASYYQRQMESAMGDLWKRLHDNLQRFVKQLDVDEDGKKGKVFDSTIENVQHLTDMLEHCNFTDDPSLQLAQRKLASSLAGVTRGDIVGNEGYRANLKQDMENAIKALPTLDF
jgi:hypothetical protein